MSNKTYSLNESNIQNLDFELIYITQAEYGVDWHSTMHHHQFTELFFITDGQGHMEFSDNLVPLTEGDLIIINPNCPHTEKSSNSSKPLKYIVFAINNLALDNTVTSDIISENYFKPYKILNFNSNKEEILHYLTTLLREVEERAINYELACKSLLNLFLIYIVRQSKTTLFVKCDSPKINLECLKIKNYIESHYYENITLDQLSALFHINKFHLSHLFTKQMGISPINYLIDKRIEESKNLLANTNHSIINISTMVGFSNSSYFSQMFKKITGNSPRSYRSSNLSKLKINKTGLPLK